MKFAPFYFFAFILPPALLGIIKAVSTFSDVMIPKGSPPSISSTLVSPKPDRSKPTVLILMGTQGTQLSELLTSYEILSDSHTLNVYTVAAERKYLPTTGKIFVVPDFTFKDAPKPDYLVLPAVLDPSEPPLLDAVKLFSAQTKAVLTLSDGAQLGISAGLFRGHRATGHFLSLADLKAAEPSAQWSQTALWIEDGKLISSPGILASPEALFRLLEKAAGPAVAQATREHLGFLPGFLPGFSPTADSDFSEKHITAREWLQVFLHAGSLWGSRDVAVPIFPGIDEISLSTFIETLSRTFSKLPFPVSQSKDGVLTSHGLLIATSTFLAETPPPRWYTPLPGNKPVPQAFSEWAAPRGEIRDYSKQLPGSSGANALLLATELTQGTSFRIIEFASKTMGVPRQALDQARFSHHCHWCFKLWLQPIVLGFLGIWIATLLRARFKARIKTIRSK